jgi:hypothetical protein
MAIHRLATLEQTQSRFSRKETTMSIESRKDWYHHSARRMWLMLICLGVLLFSAAPVHGQSFVSGSTGADGPFAPTSSQAVQVPPAGVFNFTTINIPTGVNITFIRNASNSPVTMLATGNVTIAGVIGISGANGSIRSGGSGGPGGHKGGVGAISTEGFTIAISGDGPGGGSGGVGNGGGGGGGYALAGKDGGGQGGPSYGIRTLLPLLGGSGGGGSGAFGAVSGGGGGGGGGAILIASSGSITFNGASIIARGGSGACAGFACGGGGAGGAIRLVANTIAGSVALDVSGGASGSGGSGGSGYIRIEAFDSSGLNLNATPVLSLGLPQSAIPPNAPSLRIASVAGIAPVSTSGSLQGVPDILLPSSQANPVDVAIEAANIPVGSIVDVTVTPDTAARTTVQSTPLAGAQSASTATASVNIPSAGMSVITAKVSITLVSSARPLFIEGERVNRIDIGVAWGGASEVTWITQSGRRIKR